MSVNIPHDIYIAAAKEYLRALEVLKLEARKMGQYVNARLPPNAPMYYYCQICGLFVETISEIDSFERKPKPHCAACQEMVDFGYSPTLKKFPGIEL